ncbi:MAG: amino acid permease [Deltaproteobacteria bacterium]|nr:amino acid permease [Deltaproteobacteria bacterium]
MAAARGGAATGSSRALTRQLGLLDVFALSTGAMFSSGFFLLPGIAFAMAGKWFVAAYALSAVLVIPALFSKAELASAMPRSGGTYYFLERSMGPLVGTVGGLGTWLAMGLKNAFALVGLGAYVLLFYDIDMTMVAVAGAVGFTLINIFGVKETARLQRWFVFALLGILGAFLVAGVVHLEGVGRLQTLGSELAAAPGADLEGVLATIGLVFVSYAGLTKVTGVAEEIRNPDRNIRRGMILSLGAAVTVYTLGALLLLLVADPEVFKTDLAPIATAAESVFGWMPGRVGVIVIFVAAAAAFASTANAGILSASRYLLAMGRDNLIPKPFQKVGRFGTPTLAILFTGGFIVVTLLTLDVISLAKLASAFQLLMFALVNLAVIVMRESQLRTYHPQVRAPLYPWLQIFGILSSIGLILELGRLAVLFTLALFTLGVVWYFAYGKRRSQRGGAILHWFERLGRDRSEGLEREIWSILKDTGLKAGNHYLEAIDRARILEVEESVSFPVLASRAARLLGPRIPMGEEAIAAEFVRGVRSGLVPVADGIALPHFRAPGLGQHELIVARARGGITIEVEEGAGPAEVTQVVHAIFFLVSPEELPGEHLRILAKLASLLEQPAFVDTWAAAPGTESLRSLLRSSAIQEVDDQLAKGAIAQRDGRTWKPRDPEYWFSDVLVVNPSYGAGRAVLDLSERLARDDAKTRLTILHTREGEDLRDPEAALLDAEAQVAAEALLDRISRPLRSSGIEVQTRVLVGEPWVETIRQVIRDRHDLVLVAVDASQPGGPDAFTRHLLRKCPCPVLTLAPGEEVRIRRVVAAIDAAAEDPAHQALNAQILGAARRVARRSGAELHVAYAWYFPGGGLLSERGVSDTTIHSARRRQREYHDEVFKKALQGFEAEGVPLHRHLLEGRPGTAIPAFAREQEMDLIVMGTVTRTGIAGYFSGNTAEDVLARASRSVLAIKPPGFVTPIEL